MLVAVFFPFIYKSSLASVVTGVPKPNGFACQLYSRTAEVLIWHDIVLYMSMVGAHV